MMLGQSSPRAATYYPPHYESIPFAERSDAFNRWITQVEGTLCTGSARTSSELAEIVHEEPGNLPSGSDMLTVKLRSVHELYPPSRTRVFYLPPPDQNKGGANGWRDVEVRLMWCDRSIWARVWGPRRIPEELKEAKAAGRLTQNISWREPLQNSPL